MVLCPSLCGGWEQIVHSKDLYCFCALKSELCAVDTNGKKIFSDISDVLRAEICSPGRLLYTPKYGKNTNFCVYREIFKKFLSRPRQIPLSVWDKWEGGGRYNKVTLKKVSKIKCFRSFSQHRNEALLP